MDNLDPHSHTEFPDFLTEEECLHIADILRRDEHKILAIPNQDNNNFYQGTTKQHSVYNLLTHPDIRPHNIPDRIFELPIYKDQDELWIQCWGNVLHQTQSISTHTHADEDSSVTEQNPLYAMSIYLDGIDPSYTHWDGTPQRNERGTLHVAGMFHEHEVKTNIHSTPRISMAFDIYTHYETPMRDHKRFLHIKRPKPNFTQTLHETEYEGMPITVKKDSQNTWLEFGDTWLVQTIIDNQNPTKLYYPYVQQLCEVIHRVPLRRSILVLGLGGGVIPSWFSENTKCTDIDVVEINPELESIARTHFHMPKDINVIIDDAFQWIHTTPAKTYDIIVLDLAGGDGNPDPETSDITFSTNFYEGIQSRLTTRGTLAINYLAYENTQSHIKHLEQLRKIFNHVDNVGNHAEKNSITYCSNNLSILSK